MKSVRLVLALWIGIGGAAGCVGFAAGEAPPVKEPGAATAKVKMAEEDDDADSGKEAPKAKAPDPAVEKFWAAMKHLKSKAPAELAMGRAELEAAAAMEFTPAQLVLGEYLQAGEAGFAKNPKKGSANFRLAAERGNGFAMVSYGLGVFSGVGVRKDAEKAAEWFAAALGPKADFVQPTPPADFFATKDGAQEDGVAGGVEIDPVAAAQAKAHYLLGVILEGKKKAAEAQAHYVAAATAGAAGRAGIQQAALQAAVNYAFGRGVPRDVAKAKEMVAQAKALVRRSSISLLHNYATAKLVDDFAVSEIEEEIAKQSEGIEGELQLNIAHQFTDRKSKDYDPKAAVQWFELAAESGKAWAMLELAFLYSGNELGKPEPEKAFAWFERAGGGAEPKHYLGVANLVICLMNGIGTPKDPAKALEIAKQHRDAEVVCHLAALGQCPTTVLTFEQVVELNRKKAKEKDAHAQYLFARRYLNGWGVTADLSTARDWYTKAVKGGSGPACSALGHLYADAGQYWGYDYDEKQRKAVELYERGAALGDAESMASFAHMLTEGTGVKADVARGEVLYKRSLEVDPKLGWALNNLGAIYEERWSAAVAAHDAAAEKTNRTLMLDAYEKADAMDQAYAANNLGRLNYEGSLGQKDFQKAYAYFEKAAERGLVEARFRLGEMHEKGEGVEVTYTEAAYHYRLAALDGHALALRRLVTFYIEGKGGSQDLDRAGFWITQLVNRGDIGAMAAAADLMLVQGKYENAVNVLELLRDYGKEQLQGFAYERLSRCYAAGLGVKVKPAKANSYLERAFDLGNAEAIVRVGEARIAAGKQQEGIALFEKVAAKNGTAAFSLGQMNYFGQFMPKDETKALVFFRQAAASGNAEAKFFLAALTLNRAPLAPTLDEAIEFARSAEGLGHAKAGAVRERLEKRRQAEPEKKTQASAARAT